MYPPTQTSYAYPYGAPAAPSYPYGAPAGPAPYPYGQYPAQQAYPPAPYGVPQATAPYGAPPAPYGQPQYPGYPAPGASQPAQAAASAPAAPASASSAPAAPYPSIFPGLAPPAPAPIPPAPADSSAAAQQQQQHNVPSQPPTAPPAQPSPAAAGYTQAAYPSAPQPTQPPAYGQQPPMTQERPATASGAPAYGQQPSAPYTYGQPAPQHQQPTNPYAASPQPPAQHAVPSYAAAAAATHIPTAPPSYQAPSTYSPAPGHGQRRKRALLIGCGYPGTQAALNGCLNDVRCIEYCLKTRFGFVDSQILILRDDIKDEFYTSYKRNIYRGIQWLTMDMQAGDSLFFHFSGHGSQKPDTNGDEDDGYDETLCPTDYTTAGQIVDDELNALLVRPLIPGVTLHAVVDACHSGTVLDLPFRTTTDSSGRLTWKGRARADKATRGGTAFQFGACKDSQVAADTNKLSGTFTGAATFCFIQAIEKYGKKQTYGQLLSHMRSVLASQGGVSAPSGLIGAIAGIMLGIPSSGGQTPLLSCDKPFDLNTPLMLD